MLVLGLTGGIGSGKSVVAHDLRRAGASVISADDLARDIMNRSASIHRAIRREFGPSVFTAHGTPDRTALAAAVFGHPARLRSLNAIVHPPVIAALRRVIRARRRRRGILVIESALIVEAGLIPLFDYLLVVAAPKAIRLRRVAGRDGVPQAQVLRRMKAQLPERRLLARADFVLRNAGTRAALRRNAAALHAILRHLDPR